MKLQDLENITRDLRAIVEKLASNIEAARAEPDPFSVHYFAARRSYREAALTANNRHLKGAAGACVHARFFVEGACD